jgi:hypothetical protein
LRVGYLEFNPRGHFRQKVATLLRRGGSLLAEVKQLTRANPLQLLGYAL